MPVLFKSLALSALMLFSVSEINATPTKKSEARPVIRGYPIPGLGPTKIEMRDPSWDVPVVPVLPEKAGVVPKNAVPLRGYDINRGVQSARSVDPRFELKYCYSRTIRKKTAPSTSTIYLVDPADFRLMFGPAAKPLDTAFTKDK